jgi:hypothetical protein
VVVLISNKLVALVNYFIACCQLSTVGVWRLAALAALPDFARRSKLRRLRRASPRARPEGP